MRTAAPIPAPIPAFAPAGKPLDGELVEGFVTEDVVVAEAGVDVAVAETGVDVDLDIV